MDECKPLPEALVVRVKVHLVPAAVRPVPRDRTSLPFHLNFSIVEVSSWVHLGGCRDKQAQLEQL